MVALSMVPGALGSPIPCLVAKARPRPDLPLESLVELHGKARWESTRSRPPEVPITESPGRQGAQIHARRTGRLVRRGPRHADQFLDRQYGRVLVHRPEYQAFTRSTPVFRRRLNRSGQPNPIGASAQ